MNTRTLGKTGYKVSEIGLGTWQLGTKWGEPFNEQEAMKILEASYESGITLIDTADIYNDGNSERAIGKFLKTHKNRFTVVTKCGRGLNPHTAEGYTSENMEKFIDGSLQRLGTEQLDLVLLHCPPSSVYQKDELFTGMDKLVKKGKIAHYGVSIEKVSEGIQAMEYPISAIEVVFNMFRLKPSKDLFPQAKANNVGILARVPLASGLLTGRYTKDTVFGQNDHRNYNRNGQFFDKGETFSGVDYEVGLQRCRVKEVVQHRRLDSVRSSLDLNARCCQRRDSRSQQTAASVVQCGGCGTSSSFHGTNERRCRYL